MKGGQWNEGGFLQGVGFCNRMKGEWNEGGFFAGAMEKGVFLQLNEPSI